MTKQLIFIPLYNTNHLLSDLISSIRKRTEVDILIIDDGSKEVVSLANLEESNVFLERNNENRGKGYSLKKAFKYALNKDYSHLISIDSDLQHDPSEINKFIEIDSNVDLVLGKRKFSSPMPIHRRLSNTLTSTIISSINGKEIHDSQCGYRRYSMNFIKEIDKLDENGYQFESELLLKLIKNETKIEQVDINTIYLDNNKSYINKRKDTFKFIKMIMRHIFA